MERAGEPEHTQRAGLDDASGIPGMVRVELRARHEIAPAALAIRVLTSTIFCVPEVPSGIDKLVIRFDHTGLTAVTGVKHIVTAELSAKGQGYLGSNGPARLPKAQTTTDGENV